MVHERKEGRTTKGVACMIYNRLYVYTRTPRHSTGEGEDTEEARGRVLLLLLQPGMDGRPTPFPRSVDGRRTMKRE